MQDSNVVHIFKTLLRFIFEIIAFISSLFITNRPTKVTRIDKNDKILSKPATVLARAIRAGELKSEQVVETFIGQIEKVNPVINAVVYKQYDEALKRAREIDSLLAEARAEPEKSRSKEHEQLLQSPLLGIPITVKETISLEGVPMSCGLPSRRNRKSNYSNPGVDRLIKHGLIPLASTNTPCMNLWYDSYNLLHGRTLNPYDLSRIPGGSSGGEGAILASSGSCLGIGSDLAGSIRIPANFCGVFGHKASPRVISCKGLYPARTCDDMASVGPMARYACDLTPALELMITSEEAREKLRLDEPVNLRKVKIYYCQDLGDPLVSSCSADIKLAMKAAVQHLKSSYHVEATEVTFDEFKHGFFLWKAEVEGTVLYYPEAAEGIVRFNPFIEIFKSLLGLSEYPLPVIVCVMLDYLSPKEDSDEVRHLRRRAADLRKKFNELVGSDGVLMVPTFPRVAPPHKFFFQFLNVAYTAVVNVLHAPVTQCPLGKSKSGLPIGVQLIAGKHNDRLTLAVACELDKAFKGWQPVE